MPDTRVFWDFFIVVAVTFGVNLFLINPITCFFMKGCFTVEVKSLQTDDLESQLNDSATPKTRLRKYQQQAQVKNRQLMTITEESQFSEVEGEHRQSITGLSKISRSKQTSVTSKFVQ